MSQPATPETRNEIYQNMGLLIDDSTPVLKECIEIRNLLTESVTDNIYHKMFQTLLSFNIFIIYIKIELASVLRACFRATHPSEKRYNVKYINCIILEAYKHLYGYKDARKKSLWCKELAPLIYRVDDKELIIEFEALSSQIRAFGNKKITDKDQRDIAFHYDLDPIRVYKILIRLSEEVEVKRLIKFLDLLGDLSIFVGKYMQKYKQEVKYEVPFTTPSLNLMELDVFRDQKGIMISQLDKSLNTHTNLLDDFVAKKQNIPAFLKKYKMNKCSKEILLHINSVIQLFTPAIQLQYLYIDLASAIKAFLTAPTVIEKQLTIKQINTIIYEGFNKLYGFEDDKSKTYWHMFMPIYQTYERGQDTRNEFNLLVTEFRTFEIQKNLLNFQRNYSVHYKEGIPFIYNKLQELNPFHELKRSIQFVQLINKIGNLYTEVIESIDTKNTKSDKQRTQKMEHLIRLIEKSPDTPERQKVIELIRKYQSGTNT